MATKPCRRRSGVYVLKFCGGQYIFYIFLKNWHFQNFGCLRAECGCTGLGFCSLCYSNGTSLLGCACLVAGPIFRNAYSSSQERLSLLTIMHRQKKAHGLARPGRTKNPMLCAFARMTRCTTPPKEEWSHACFIDFACFPQWKSLQWPWRPHDPLHPAIGRPTGIGESGVALPSGEGQRWLSVDAWHVVAVAS
jgi:hypothetical protein